MTRTPSGTGSSATSTADPVAALVALTGRDRWLATPSRVHQAWFDIGRATRTWAGRVGHVGRDAGFDRMASRAFPDAPPAAVARFAQWLLWTFWFDDERDEGRLAASPDGLDDLFGRLLATLDAGPAADARPLEVALADLWGSTAEPMSQAWRRRFLHDFVLQWKGTRTESVNRATGRTPTLAEYPLLRRDSSGTRALLDLIEPTVGVELPSRLVSMPAWIDLTDALDDVVNWTNDLVSLPKERAGNDVHNYVIVASAALGIDGPAATRWVADRVVARLADMRTAVAALPDDPDAARVVDVIVRTPRANVEWLLESRRYQPPAR